MNPELASAETETAPAERNGVILDARHVSKLFPGIVALQDVDFQVYRGRVNVLIGENGAGKSTLMKILAGVEQPTTGEILLDGSPVSFRSPRDAARAGIGIIYQELNLFPNLSIAENIFAAHELSRNGVVRHRLQEERAKEVLARLEQPLNPRTLVSDLRIGQQQIVEIAKALAQDVRILIMDEPTSALTNAETEALFRIVRELTSQGVALIYISHKLEELLRIGDYFTVLRDGKLAAKAERNDISISWIIEKMVGRTVRAPSRQDGAHVTENNGPILEVENLTLPRVGSGFTLENVSFSLRGGEIVAIYGLMGSGRTEMLECLMGLHPEATGIISLRGKPLGTTTVSERIERGITLVPEDRQRLGLVQQLSVGKNLTLASLRRYLTLFWLSDRREQEATGAVIRDLAIKTRSVEQPVTALSGGNQQKVVLAKSLLAKPDVLLLDEPTRGIDVGAKAEIFQIVNRLSEQGLAILFVSSELPEVLAVPDRILVLAKGHITGEFAHADVTEEKLVQAASSRLTMARGDHLAEPSNR